MINTTDFLDALRNFEYVAKQNLPKDLKVNAKIHLFNELERLKRKIDYVDLGESNIE